MGRRRGVRSFSTTTEQHLKDRLDDLGQHVAVRKDQLKHGSASWHHDSVMGEARRRRAAIQRRIDAALEKELFWDLIKAELELEIQWRVSQLLELAGTSGRPNRRQHENGLTSWSRHLAGKNGSHIGRGNRRAYARLLAEGRRIPTHSGRAGTGLADGRLRCRLL